MVFNFKVAFMKMKFIILLNIFILSFFVSCSKEDGDNTDKNGGEAFGAKIVYVTVSPGSLTNYQYQGTINGVTVDLIKVDEDTLAFTMPNDLSSTQATLIIPGLSNLTVNYTVTPTTLGQQTAAEVLDPFFSNMDNCFQSLGTTTQEINVKNSINTFKNYYNSASASEKESIAIAYKANKTVIDGILLNDLSVVSRDLVDETTTHIKIHKKNVAIMAIGVALTVTNPFIGIPVAAIGAYRAYKANANAIENIYSTISANVGGWFTNRGINAPGIVLVDNIEKTVVFNFRSRKMIAADASKTDPLAVEYFKNYNLQNNYVDKGNPIIDKFNTQKGTNYSHIENLTLPTSEPVNDVPADMTRQKYLVVQSNSPSVSVVSSVLDSGNLKLKVKYVGSPSTIPVSTTLKVSYSDGFSSFSGSIPVEVNPSIVGTWKCQTFENGTKVGSYFDLFLHTNCPSIASQAYTVESETYTISETTFSYSSKEVYKYYNKYLTDCKVTKDDPDTFETFNESGSGTYQFSSGIITAYLTGSPSPVSFSVQFLNANTIKIDDKVYTRQ